ncbi:hypothetical protein GOBAR_AA27670 [Gossypium barbadense]|uniref:Uncharacterized protein n=1 Tax=Gossypium barbadense TaxID=3634 RepID=A0A2P5WPI1_GOSBA|nr:hypothetical protein GOBAR_AA27670 [Gossypium barbadense]
MLGKEGGRAPKTNPKLLKLQPKGQQGQPYKGYRLPVRSRKTKPDAVGKRGGSLHKAVEEKPEKEKARSELYPVGSEEKQKEK